MVRLGEIKEMEARQLKQLVWHLGSCSLHLNHSTRFNFNSIKPSNTWSFKRKHVGIFASNWYPLTLRHYYSFGKHKAKYTATWTLSKLSIAPFTVPCYLLASRETNWITLPLQLSIWLRPIHNACQTWRCFNLQAHVWKNQESFGAFGICSTYTYNTDAFWLQYMVWVKLSDSPTLTELAFGGLPRIAKVPRADFTEEEVSPSVESCNHSRTKPLCMMTTFLIPVMNK